MPKRVPIAEMEPVLRSISQFSTGASVSAILGALDVALPRRTLQRWLARLVEMGRVEAFGAGPARRYRVIDSHARVEAASSTVRESMPYDLHIPLSVEAEEVRACIQQLFQMRQPVGYNSDFLADYEPNQTFYLDESLRFRLRELGQSRYESRPAGAYARKICQQLLTDLAWNSSRLEGNTYSLLETVQLLHTGRPAEGKGVHETQMILNHRAAIDLLLDTPEEIAFNRHTLCNLHLLLSKNLLPDPAAWGRLRTIPASIGGSACTPPSDPVCVDSVFQSLLEKANAIEDPFEQAFFAMVHLPYLQPFEDVNKCVSRLAANIPFIRMNLVPLSFVDIPEKVYVSGLSGVCELNRLDLLRDLFAWAYERSCNRFMTVRQVLGEPDLFRIRYRELIEELVLEVVRARSNKSQAAIWVRAFAQVRLPVRDQVRFAEVVETELLSMHEGSIAGYRVRLTEFRDWQRRW